MMARKHRRLWLVSACLLAFGGATALTLSAFSGDIVYFMLPGAVLAQHPRPGQVFRLGGIVEQGSLHAAKVDGAPGVTFGVTDEHGHVVTATYAGVLPDLFREGQGIVAVGALSDGGIFQAHEVLAKHSADYMPPEVEQALKKDGLWNPATGKPPPAAAFRADAPHLAQAGG